MDVKAEATEAAMRLLVDHWTGGIPVEPAWIARVMGIKVAHEDLDADVSGFIAQQDGQARIHLNRSMGKVRSRFTLAHEIGHFIRNQDPDFEYTAYRDGMSSQGVSEDEIFANAFAAALLMPETTIQELIEIGAGEKQMARELGVSVAAVVNRLKSLGWYPLPGRT